MTEFQGFSVRFFDNIFVMDYGILDEKGIVEGLRHHFQGPGYTQGNVVLHLF